MSPALRWLRDTKRTTAYAAEVVVDGVAYYAAWEHHVGSASDPNQWNWRVGSFRFELHERGAAKTSSDCETAITAAVERLESKRARKGRAA